MNLLCPNCQKMLTVPEQYAGQLMKCPMCSSNFTVPALPPGGAPEPPAAPAFAAEPPPPPPPADTYGVKHDPVPAFAPPPAPPPAPAPAPPVPAFATSPPSPALGSTITDAPKSTSPLPPPKAGDYTDGFRIVFDPKVLQYVPAVALLIVLMLHFFPWIGVYAGGIPVLTQGAWGAAVGSYTTPDPDLNEKFAVVTPAKARELNEGKKKDEPPVVSNEPGFSLLLFFYLVPLFFLTLVATVGVVALPYINTPLPPAVQQILPWKWAIVAGLNGLLLLFLLLQVVLPFSLENSVAAWADSKHQAKEGERTHERQVRLAERGMDVEKVQRTIWWRLAVFLHIVAAVAAALVYWVEKRGPARPLPALELRY
jgi:hypothetical protein